MTNQERYDAMTPDYRDIDHSAELEAAERADAVWQEGYLAFHAGKPQKSGPKRPLQDRIAFEAGWEKAEEVDWEQAAETVVVPVSALFRSAA